MNLALLANGPGEVWGWCRPFILNVAKKGWNVDVHLLPCPFASGRELDALSTMPAHILRHSSTVDAFLSFTSAKGYDAVLQFGGDLIFGRFLAWKCKVPLACYSYGRKNGMKHCAAVMTSREGLFKADRMEIVGDLVLDSLDIGTPGEWKAPIGSRIAAFPGSRPQIRKKAFYLLKGIRDRLVKLIPDVEIRVLLSPFSEQDEVPMWVKEGFSVWQGTTPDGIKGADLALTQPGTNTLELMYCEQPFAVTIPFSFIRQIPISGLIGILTQIPILGPAAREKYIRKRLPRYIGKTAWPNRLAGCQFAPEIIGEYSPADIAEKVAEILSDSGGLAKQRKKLHELAVQVKYGAPQRICDILERMVASNGGQ